MAHIQIKQREYERIEARFACIHEHEVIRQRTIADGRTTYVRQCLRCGKTSTPIKPKAALIEAAGEPITPYNDYLPIRWRKAKSLAYDEARQRLQPELKKERERYLSTPEWKKLREVVIEREGGICEVCGEQPITEIHHIHYDRLGAERLGDLMGLCSECHGLIHGQERKIK